MGLIFLAICLSGVLSLVRNGITALYEGPIVQGSSDARRVRCFGQMCELQLPCQGQGDCPGMHTDRT